MRFVFVRVNLLGLLGVLVGKRPEDVVLYHLERGLEDWFRVERIK